MTRPRFCGVSSSRAKSGQNYLSMFFIIYFWYQNPPRCRSGSERAWRVHRFRKVILLICERRWCLFSLISKIQFRRVCMYPSEQNKSIFPHSVVHTLSLSLFGAACTSCDAVPSD
jgi:hypothetical protein